MASGVLLIDYQGTYGGPASRDEVLRVLREALALVEATPRDAVITCAGLRIESSEPAVGHARRPGGGSAARG